MNSKVNLTTVYFNLDIINKFETFEEIPSTKPLLLANRNGEILYSNSSLKNEYKLSEGSNLFNLKTEPDFRSLFDNLVNSKLFNFGCDLLINIEGGLYESYLLNI